MADIKTRDAVKGTIKTLDKAAIAGERMKSVYAKTKDKAEQGYYAEENSPTEYASDKVSHASGRIRDEGIHQFNKQGQKNVQTTKENIGRAKDKITEFKTKRAVKAAEQKKTQAVAEQNGSLIRNGEASRSPVPDVPKQGEMPQTQTGASQLIKTRRQGSPLRGYHDAIRRKQGNKGEWFRVIHCRHGIENAANPLYVYRLRG